ncbi:hypothetical protein GBAR_LOCUS14015 [Geodia barretti]|uniref:PH domain-containing protein n=1 Tax=Geodia barretti TaxID=519541 RepID=A0AA35S6E4_GEOBA|nr:hypothetical protein GBAR_LOCUS14015 [Geodia barretti]
MNAWIQALQEEMKSSGSYVSGGPVNYGGSSKVKVDQKAIEEVTKAASDGPKLTHLTAQRPRVKGRRPPKRYATYHEEDKDESPPATPTFDRNTPAASPQPSPSASPTSKTKGHRPAVPLMPKQRSITSSPPPTSNESPKVTKILPTPPAKVAKEKEEVQADVVPVPKQRPLPPKRPLKPRSATDAPVTQPRPVPAPRRVVGKEGAIFPAKDLPPDEDKDVDVEQAEKESPVTETPSTQETAQEISTNESPLTAPEDTTKQEEKVNEMVENRIPINVHVMEEKLHTNDTKTTETPPTPQPQEENKTSTDISTGDKEDNRAVSEHNQEKRHVSSADEYEHMKPGVTKDKSQGSKKSPQYEHLDVPCSPSTSTPSPQKQDSKYATPSAATKQKETTYAVPHVTGDTNASVLPATPQISLVASENEENLTTGSGKSSIPQQSEDHLKPVKFEIERDALGYSKG